MGCESRIAFCGGGVKVYLCGPIHGRNDFDAKNWREYVKSRLPDTLDPMRRDFRGMEFEPGIAEQIVSGDEKDIGCSDALLVYYDRPSVGTAMEIRMAVKELGKTVVLVDVSNAPLSPWLIYHCPVRFKTLDEAIDYLA
jgi:nucleoside 2-deoxyribosyltransferase